jgi:hypothetical protein
MSVGPFVIAPTLFYACVVGAFFAGIFSGVLLAMSYYYLFFLRNEPDYELDWNTWKENK